MKTVYSVRGSALRFGSQPYAEKGITMSPYGEEVAINDQGNRLMFLVLRGDRIYI